MRIRALRLSTTLAVATALGLGAAGSASAATLYTTGAHTTQVAVGATSSLTTTTPWVWTSATSVLNQCTAATVGTAIDQNSAGTVVATVRSGAFTGCSPFAFVGTFATPWRLQIDGTPTTVAGVTSWTASLSGVVFDLGGGTYTGNITTGVTARQTGAGGATCVTFADAGTFSGPLTANGRFDSNFCFEGTASTYSLT